MNRTRQGLPRRPRGALNADETNVGKGQQRFERTEAQHVVEQHAQVSIHWVHATHLFVKITSEYFNVARFVRDGEGRPGIDWSELERVVRDALPRAADTPTRARQLPPGWQPA